MKNQLVEFEKQILRRSCYVDEQHRPFRLGYLAFVDPRTQQELLRVLRLYRREYRLKLHSKDDYKNAKTRAAGTRLAQFLETFISNYPGLKTGIIQSREPYLELLNVLVRYKFSWRIESDQTTIRKDELTKFRTQLSFCGFEFQAVPKNLQSPLIGAVDYLLYYEIIK